MMIKFAETRICIIVLQFLQIIMGNMLIRC